MKFKPFNFLSKKIVKEDASTSDPKKVLSQEGMSKVFSNNASTSKFQTKFTEKNTEAENQKETE